MNTRYFVLVMGIVLVACSVPTESPPTALPEPTAPREPTATPTELIETELPHSPSPTDTPPATPTQIPTETPLPIQLNFTWYENNPILTTGSSSEWDYWSVWDSKVVLIDDVFHMFYTGTGQDSIGIGYAVSSDGFEFTKHDANPIIQPDGEGFDAIGVGNATPLVVEDTWILFYNGSAPGEMLSKDLGGGLTIGLTSAPDPTGPWTTGQQVLTVGRSGEWDSGFVIPTSVIYTEDGFRMYYTAGTESNLEKRMCGMATSQGGIIWTKYDDPGTTEFPFADSDPVMQPSSNGWDSTGIHCSVLKTDTGWDMFYEGRREDWTAHIGYANSNDGVQWLKYPDNPILSEKRAFPLAIKVGSTYYLYSENFRQHVLVAATGTIDHQP